MAYEQQKDDGVKRRKIRKTDWEKVKSFLKKELENRKGNPFRRAHEQIWKEVDRQISMEPMKKYLPNGKEIPPGWQSAFELGELSKASEVITADVMRLMFPSSRSWMEPHVKPPVQLDQNSGKPLQTDPRKQKMVDGLMKALMTQQHVDFGFKARVELSVKEALHHGSFVATAEDEQMNKIYDGQGVVSLNAPVWKPHSMWNCYPDMSPAVVPGSIFYSGSMMIVSYMPRYKVLALKGDGYMNISDEKIPKTKGKNNSNSNDTDDVELVTYYGDLNIDREDGDIFLPNSKCQTANGEIIFYKANPLPFPEVIYQGYERQDIRDPYFTSPIVKNSPMQKVATILANELIDGIKLWAQPPGTYDGNDGYLVQTGGPQIYPGAMTPSKGSNKVTFMTVGDPKITLMGLQFSLQKLEEGTSVNAIRSGAQESDRKTATEVNRTSQGAEVRTVDFVDKMENGALRPFLYMQHELNLADKNFSYQFYCPEKGLPDFVEIKRAQLPKIVHFEVVGSKGILGEQERAQRSAAVTAFIVQAGLGQMLNLPDIFKDMYEDAGVKSAETYINTEKAKIPPQVQQQIQQLQQALQECQQELAKEKQGGQAKMAEIQAKVDLANKQFMADMQNAQKEQALEARQQQIDAAFQRWEAHLKASTELAQAHIKAAASVEAARITAAAKPKTEKKAA